MTGNTRIAAWSVGLIVFVTVAARCSGGEPNDVDAGDAKDDPFCPMNVPDAPEFSCEAGPPDSGGCVGPPNVWCGTCGFDYDSGLNYPIGCKLTLPVPTLYCGPEVCTCYGYWQCPQ